MYVPVDVVVILDVHEVVEPAGRLGVMAATRLVISVHRAQVRFVLEPVTGRSDGPNAAAAPPRSEPLLVVGILASTRQIYIRKETKPMNGD